MPALTRDARKLKKSTLLTHINFFGTIPARVPFHSQQENSTLTVLHFTTTMFPYIALAIVTLPVVEILSIYLMWWWTGIFATALWIILTGFCGIIFAKSQGMRYWSLINTELDKGQQPTDDVLHELLILFAGFSLILPGIFTDMIGFALFLPPIRNRVVKKIKETFTKYRKKSQPSASETVHSADEYNAKEDVIDA